MRSAFLLPFLILLSTTFVMAQEAPVEIIGEIIDKDSGDPVPYVHIINIRSQLGTVSNEQGRFYMRMQREDSLTVSAIGFEPYLFTLKEAVSSRKIEVTIAMNTATLELEPVRVFAYKNEESLKQAILEMEITTTEDRARIELPGFYYGPPKPYKPSAFGNPISFIASRFSKEVKELKKLEKARVEEDYRKMIRAKYNESIVMELTGLPEDEVRDFMDFCKIEEAYIARSGPYEIALAVSNCMKEYKDAK